VAPVSREARLIPTAMGKSPNSYALSDSILNHLDSACGLKALKYLHIEFFSPETAMQGRVRSSEALPAVLFVCTSLPLGVKGCPRRVWTASRRG